MLNDTALNVGANAIAAAYPYLSIHTTGAVTSSANESTAARVAANWAAASGGDFSLTAPVNFTGGAASGPAVRVGYWSASSGGTYGGGVLLTGDQTFNAAGEYTVNDIDENASST
jgi:hypothetical protein